MYDTTTPPVILVGFIVEKYIVPAIASLLRGLFLPALFMRLSFMYEVDPSVAKYLFTAIICRVFM